MITMVVMDTTKLSSRKLMFAYSFVGVDVPPQSGDAHQRSLTSIEVVESGLWKIPSEFSDEFFV